MSVDLKLTSASGNLIRALVLDVGGVIIKYSNITSHNKLIEYLQITPQVYQDAFAKMRKKLSIGELSENEGWELFCKEINKSAEIDLLKSEFRKQMKEYLIENHLINYELINMLKKIKSNGLKLAALPNTTVMNTEVYYDLGIYSIFDFVVTSFQEKMKKPNPLFFKIALKYLQLTPKETIFIDDSPWHVEAAKKFGMNVILYEDNNKLISSLESFGIK